MPTDRDDKDAIIRQLRLAERRSQKLAMLLRFQGQFVQAEQVEEETKELSETIDGLRNDVLYGWRGDTTPVLARLEAALGELQAAIDRIGERHDVSNNAARALGKLDEIVGTGRYMLE